ncbi:translation initiation factor IF-6 [Candidatus Woesearchaeota archaeon]|nr:MAG: translation initiation factor IF-6 [Candidatus Woesearchaeota archaeon]
MLKTLEYRVTACQQAEFFFKTLTGTLIKRPFIPVFMHITKTSFAGNPNIGLYAFCTDKFCLVGGEVSDKEKKILEEILKVPVHIVSVAGTPLVGVFVAGTEDVLLVPEIVFQHELEALRELGLNVKIVPGRITALGNSVLATNEGCLVSKDLSEEARTEIERALGVPVKAGMIAGLPNVGALAALTSKGVLISSQAEDFEVEFVETLLKSKCTKGTVNGGSSYIKSGVIANAHGIVAGSQTTGLELDNLDRAFGFLAD